MATNGMTINGLNPLSALTADDKIPVWDTGASGEPTKEITAQNMANSVKSLAGLPNTTEMNEAIAQSMATFASDESKELSTSWTMVKDIEIPAKTAYGFEARQFFSNVEPKGMGVSVITSLNTYSSMIVQDSNGAIISFTGYNSSSLPTHRYIFAKADGSGTNNIIINGWFRPM